jgi:zinc protease
MSSRIGLRWRFATFLAVIISVLVATASRAAESGVLRATLTNGLRIVIVPNTLAPVVSTSLNYLVGSDEAPKGFPGMAHAQEHMMFRGSLGLNADQLANIGSIMGGNFNASTTQNLTQYIFTVPASDLDVVLHIEALRMANVTDSKQGWDQERGALKQEVAQDVSSPEYIAHDRLRAAMFADTPYEHDALGTRETFDSTTPSMLKSFHDTWYAPNNAVLVVVGDIDPTTTLEKIKSFFGAIQPKILPPRAPIALKPVDRTPITVETDRPVATRMIAMRLPGLNNPDFPALELLADVLASRRFELYGLVPQGKAIRANFSIDPLPEASIGTASISIRPGGDIDGAEQEVRKILERVARDGVPVDLVAAAKIQEHREAEFSKNSIENLASVWSDAIALNGLQSPEEDLERTDKVTPEEVNRVARKYLALENAVSVTAMPRNGKRSPIAEESSFGRENITLDEAKSPTRNSNMTYFRPC